METSTLLTLSFLVYIASSASTRFIISEYTIPVGDPLIFPYPLDTCVNYELTMSGGLFGKFTCNAGGDTVTFTSYTDDTCTTADSSKTPTDYTPSAADFALHSFQCVGDDNYVKVHTCKVDAVGTEPAVGDDGGVVVCCGDCAPQTQATGVCIDQGNSVYTMTSCGNVTSITNAYGAAGCAGAALIPGADGIVSSSDIDGCGFYSREYNVFDIYRRMLECVEVAEDIATDDYCPSDAPTKSPTNNPTPSPVDETTEDATNDVSSYFVKNVFALVLVIVVYMK